MEIANTLRQHPEWEMKAISNYVNHIVKDETITSKGTFYHLIEKLKHQVDLEPDIRACRQLTPTPSSRA
jgi:hypothetical protein